MRCADTHCHLQMGQFDPDRDIVLERALAHLEWIVVIGDDLAGSAAACALVRPRVFAAVGCHPYSAAHWSRDVETELRTLAAHPGVVAVGEMGLDYHNEYSPRALQGPCFEAQLEVACDLGLPAVIHNRAADDDTAAILRRYIPRLAGCVLHCFGGSPAFARQCVDLGCFLSFAGNVTYPKAESLREAALLTPVDQLLVETDAPYLAPQCVRGKRCEPHHVLHTLEFLAHLKGIVPEVLAAQTLDNGIRLFFSKDK